MAEEAQPTPGGGEEGETLANKLQRISAALNQLDEALAGNAGCEE